MSGMPHGMPAMAALPALKMNGRVGREVIDLEMNAQTKLKADVSMPFSRAVWRFMLVLLVLVYASYTILVHLCEEDGEISFSSSAMVFVTELMKFLISLSLLLRETSSKALYLPSLREIVPFSVPALLYTFNNNLAVHMQLQMDPATYQVLSNLKILSTAALYRVIIKRPISEAQWLALGLLAVAGGLNSYGGLHAQNSSTSAGVIHLSFQGLVMISLYASVSGLAGVYTEYILKGRYEMSLHLQNSLLYIFCAILNGFSWMVTIVSSDAPAGTLSLFEGFNIYVWILVFSQAVCGLLMSAVMKHGSNLTRLILISCAMLVTTLLSILIFHLRLNIFFCLSFGLVFFALVLYHKA